MARLRPAKCYREPGKAYTRKSRFKKKSFVRGVPGSKVVMYDMGEKGKHFGWRVSLISQEAKQIRHNSLESARMAAVRRLSRLIGNYGYYFKIKTYPHQVLRENPIAAGAGADRYSTGMTKAFGKPISVAARVKPGQEVMFVSTTKENIEKAKEALKKASDKMGCKFKIVVSEENINKQ